MGGRTGNSAQPEHYFLLQTERWFPGQNDHCIPGGKADLGATDIDLVADTFGACVPAKPKPGSYRRDQTRCCCFFSLSNK